MDINFKRFLTPEEVPADIKNTPDGRSHIVFNQNTRRCWFCSPGFFEFHVMYPEDPWELIRDTKEGNIVTIIETICNLIDRKKWINKVEEKE